MNINEPFPIPGEDLDPPKETRDARYRWDIMKTRGVDRRYFNEETEPGATQEMDTLYDQINELWDKLDAERMNGFLPMKEDVDAVRQKIDAAIAISNDPDLLAIRKDFLSKYPDVGDQRA